MTVLQGLTLRAFHDRIGATDPWSHARSCRHVRTGRVGTWTQAHRRWITLAALLIVVLLFALWNHPTALTIVPLVIIPLAVLALLALLAASGRATALDAERVTPHHPDSGE